ncbi:galactose-1-phosphate uridylyltransferase [Candidatus Poribacteria bacterium]|nr:galactose-1-phosphate uridylyltransferase [Candidatus Poribacteria bacterium]
MPELRKDPVTGRWVIISAERAKRPAKLVRPVPTNKIDAFDPFLPGGEDKTPGEVLAYRPPGSAANSPGWWLRVVPNKFPALETQGEIRRSGDGMYDLMNGIGQHEIVIETPDADIQLPDMDEEQVQEVIWAFRDRSVEMHKDSRFRYVLIFKNYGKEAGASIWHPHSQIIALPIVPKNVQEELEGARRYHDYKERCVYCDMSHQEIKDQRRIVMENDGFVAFCPYAPRFPFETWILPKPHEQFFSDVTKNGVIDLARILKGTLRKLKLALNDPAYNFIIHTTPDDEGPIPYYHWHIEILPALSRVAGFEWGSGFFINPVAPEEAAQILREAELPRSASVPDILKPDLDEVEVLAPTHPKPVHAEDTGRKHRA